MNYRHAFHAGNFADVTKHAILARLVDYLKGKDKPFRVIDTHAGAGLYDLRADASARTGEWRNGIGRLFAADLPADAARLLAPYLQAVEAVRTADADHYPGSPLLVRRLLRRQDRLTAIELHPDDAARLRQLFAGDHQVRVIELDGWLALGAHLPPKERRGIVLVDPPFEEPGEFGRLVEGLGKAVRRWPGGIYALWYPVKHRSAVSAFRDEVARLALPRVVDIRLEIRAPSALPALDGSGMMIVNSPYTLEAELGVLMPALTRVLADGSGARWSVETIGTQRA